MTPEMKRILLVDDEVGLTRLLRRSLEDLGAYEVQTADSGSAGLAAARTFHPDLILLDVVMPGMGGREFAATLRRDEELSKIPILFLTALPPADGSHAAAATLDGYPCIEKPLSSEEVIAAIETTLQAHRSHGDAL